MDKREAIHFLIDKLLDAEAETGRCLFFDYAGHVDAFKFHFASDKKNYSAWLEGDHWVLLDGGRVSPDHFERALSKIEFLKSCPLPPPEDEEISITIKTSKAKELGLLS